MKQVNWGVIGVGSVCEVKSVPAMYKTPNSKVISVMRRTAAKAEDFAKRHAIENWTTNASEVIEHPDIDIVYIATPPKYHKQYALQVAAAGKACYIEKPMAVTYQACKDIVTVFKQKQLPLYVAYYRTCLPNFLKVKEFLDNGKIGKPLQVQLNLTKPLDVVKEGYFETNWRINPDVAGDGYFYDLGSHQINILEFLFGDIIAVNSMVDNQSKLHACNDVVSAQIRFKNKCIATCFWSFNTATPQRKDELIIKGELGVLKMACFNDAPIEFTDTKGVVSSTKISYPEHVQLPLVTSIVNDLLTDKTNTYSTGNKGAQTNYWLEQISGLVKERQNLN